MNCCLGGQLVRWRGDEVRSASRGLSHWALIMPIYWAGGRKTFFDVMLQVVVGALTGSCWLVLGCK